MNYREIIGQRLRMCRKQKGWTTEDVANRLNITKSRYSNWEQGLRSPKQEQIFDLADIFDKAPAWIAGYSDVEAQPANSLHFVALNESTISLKDTILKLQSVSDSSALNINYIKRRGLNENKLTMLLAPDSSMAGDKDIIIEGDEILIDRTHTTPNKADLFAILVNDQIWIRWIRPEITGTYTIAAEDKENYPDKHLSLEELSELKIVGRVTRICRDR